MRFSTAPFRAHLPRLTTSFQWQGQHRLSTGDPHPPHVEHTKQQWKQHTVVHLVAANIMGEKYDFIYSPRKSDLNYHRPAFNDIVTFTNSPGTGDNIGIALVHEENPHAGSIRKYDLQRFQAPRDLERSLGRPFHGRIVSIGEEYPGDDGGGMCCEGVVEIELV